MQPPAGVFSPREPWGLYTPLSLLLPSPLRFENVAQAARNERELALSRSRRDQGSWTCIRYVPLYKVPDLFFFWVRFFAVRFFFWERERMRMEIDRWKGERLDFDLKEYLIVQRALLSDSRIGLELLVKMVLLESFQICIQFIDTILCCKIRIFQIYRYIFLLVVPLNLSFPRYKLYKFDTSCSFRFFLPLTVSGRQRIKSETTTGRTRGPSCANIHVCFVHFRISFPFPPSQKDGA